MRRFARVFAYGGLAIRCVSADADDLAWLEEFVEPSFAVDDTRPAVCEIVLTADDGRFESARTAGPDPRGGGIPWFSFDGRAADYPLWSSSEGALRVYDEEIDVFYVVDPAASRAEVLARTRTRAPRIALLRVLRELATAHANHPGAVHLHASAFAYRGRAVAVVGPKRSGKTSLLLHALGDPATQYVANDRVFLSLRPNGVAALRGMPTVVTVRADAAGLFCGHDLRRGNGYRAYFTRAEASARAELGDATQSRPLSLSPAHFCQLLRISAIAEAPLAALVFPRVDSGANGIGVRKIDAPTATRRLRDALLPVCDSLLARTLLPGRREGTGHDACAALAAAAPALECVLGRGAYDDPLARSGLLDRLVPASVRRDDPWVLTA